MEEEVKQEKVETGENVDKSAQDYIDTIKKLTENSVPREKFEKLEAEKKAILDEIVNGSSRAKEEEAKVVPTIKELREELFGSESGELNNLEFTTKALELRRQLISKGEPDPFLPVGKQSTPEQSDIAAAERVASVLQECVDYAEGDNLVFTNELQRRTVDVKVR